MNRRQALFGVVACGSLALWPRSVAAQKKPKGGKKDKGAGQEKENELRLEGAVKQISSEGLLVTTEDGSRYLLAFLATSEVTVEGEATQEFLNPGGYVEFEVELDRAGKSTGPIAALTFVTPNAKNPPGLFPTQQAEPGRPAVENAKTTYLARGKIAPPRDGMLVVQTGQKTVSTFVAADATLSARLGNWTLAAVGDEVKGTVELLPQANTGVTRALVKRIKVQAAEPLRAPKK